jgi:hypothetical protein
LLLLTVKAAYTNTSMKEEEHIEKLKKLAGGEPMHVPEGYFENFSSRIQDRISAEYRRENTVPELFRTRIKQRLVPALALVSVLIFAGIFTIKWLYKPQELFIPQAQVSELIEYSGYNFDESQLMDAIETPKENSTEAHDEKQIMEYLSTQDVDLTDVTVDL